MASIFFYGYFEIFFGLPAPLAGPVDLAGFAAGFAPAVLLLFRFAILFSLAFARISVIPRSSAAFLLASEKFFAASF